MDSCTTYIRPSLLVLIDTENEAVHGRIRLPKGGWEKGLYMELLWRRRRRHPMYKAHMLHCVWCAAILMNFYKNAGRRFVEWYYRPGNKGYHASRQDFQR